MGDFTHLDDQGRARMVDVGDKASSRRKAIARAEIHMSPETIQALTQGGIPKGDVLAVVHQSTVPVRPKPD